MLSGASLGQLKAEGKALVHLKKIPTGCTVLLSQASQAHPTSTRTPDSSGLLHGVALSVPTSAGKFGGRDLPEA